MKISKHLCLFILVVPCLFSCSFDKPSSESMERVKIDNAIASISTLYQRTSVRLTTFTPEYSSWYDYKAEYIEALKGINYQEIKKSEESNPALLYFGNGENYTDIILHTSLDFLTVRYFQDGPLPPPDVTRYYRISKEDGQMLLDTATRIKEDYHNFLDTGGNIEDYKALNKPIYLCFQLPEKDIKTDYDHVVFDKIKTIEHIEAHPPINEQQPVVLSYDINNGSKVDREGFCWNYHLLDDYTTVRLDFLYEYYVNTYDTVTKKRSYFYQISEADGRALVNTAKGARTIDY